MACHRSDRRPPHRTQRHRDRAGIILVVNADRHPRSSSGPTRRAACGLTLLARSRRTRTATARCIVLLLVSRLSWPLAATPLRRLPVLLTCWPGLVWPHVFGLRADGRSYRVGVIATWRCRGAVCLVAKLGA